MKIALVFNPKKPLIKETLKKIEVWGKRHAHEIATAPPLDATIDFLLALGGDGTMLRAVREAGELELPIMGINLGGLGFLTAFQSADIDQALDDLHHKRIRIEERMLFRIRLHNKKFTALNDVTINMSTDARVIELSTFVNGEFLTRFTGDGLIVSTPTGSTAYSLAAGGPILYPSLQGIILTPICPHALSARPVVVPAQDTITIKLGHKNPTALLSIDGQEKHLLETAHQVTISKADRYARIVMPARVSFFEILRHKMRWGGLRHE